MHAVDGDELFGKDGESFGFPHAGLEHDVPHEAPHFAVVVGVGQVAVFAASGVECGLRRLGRLSGFEDLGGLRLVARRCCSERRIRWDEAFADRCVEYLLKSEIVVVDGFASVFFGEFGAHSVDGGGGYSVESHSADDAADGVAVGSVGFEGAGFDVGRYGVEPSVHPFAERWGSGQRHIALALQSFDFFLEPLPGGGLGGGLCLDHAAFAGARVWCDLFARVPCSAFVLPFAAASSRSAWWCFGRRRFVLFGHHASSLVMLCGSWRSCYRSCYRGHNQARLAQILQSR